MCAEFAARGYFSLKQLFILELLQDEWTFFLNTLAIAQ
jgi:hypothetical protein